MLSDSVENIDVHIDGMDDDVFRIEIGELNHEAHNGLSRAFRDAYESDTRVVVVTGKHDAFLGPMTYDLDYVATLEDSEEMRQCFREGEEILDSMFNVEKPIIARVNGTGAASLGATVALACDLVVAEEGATFSDPHVTGFGIPAGDGGGVVWPLRIGWGQAMEILLTGKEVSATEAEEMGLINYAVPADELDQKVDELVDAIASSGQVGVRYTKKMLIQYAQRAMNLNWGYGMALETMATESDDFTEAIAAMQEGREPDFPSGR